MRLASIYGLALSVIVTAVSHGDVLLEVDVSAPTAVSFTATTNAAELDDSTTTAAPGVTLLSFFSDNGGGSGLLTGDLTPAGAPSNYASADTIALGLNFNAGFFPQNFSTSQPAFTGSSVVNLAGSPLPIVGASGDIVVGNGFEGSGAVIGQWQVTAVPEPSAFLLLGFVGLPAGYMRWRSRR